MYCFLIFLSFILHSPFVSKHMFEIFFSKCKVVHIDNVRQRATVKVIPRIDLQALANKLVCFCSFFILVTHIR